MKEETKIYGIRAVIEALKSNTAIDKVFIQKKTGGESFRRLENLLKQNGINTSYVPIEKLNRLSKGGNHQGVIASISPIACVDLDTLVTEVMASETKPLFLLLDQISDVRNFGAIVRTAECTGVSGIIIQKKGGAPLSGDAIKTSAGAIFKIPICKVDHIKDAIFHMQASDIKVIAATEKANESLYKTDFNQPCALVMGAEGKGISASVLNLVDMKSKLPLLGSTGSLNVSVACGAFLYEVLRQRL